MLGERGLRVPRYLVSIGVTANGISFSESYAAGTQGPESHSEDRSPVTSRQDYVTVFGSSRFQNFQLSESTQNA